MRGILAAAALVAAVSIHVRGGERRAAADGTPAAGAVAVAPAVPAPAPATATVPGRAATLELTFTGDIMFGGFFGGIYAPKRPEEGDPLSDVHALLQSDLALANLETPLLHTLPAEEKDIKKMHFVATPAHAAVLPKHGITAVSVANNHQFDMRSAGARETLDILAELGITPVGAPRDAEPLVRVETLEVRGWKLGIIAATKWANVRPKADEPQPVFIRPHTSLEDQLIPVIEAARADHDAVIVVLHWGTEYKDTPSSAQVRAAHAMIDHGATAIIGSHPHVLQGIERYKGGVIAYSLGNFVFRNSSEVVRQTGVLRLALRDGATAEDRCLERVEFHPAIEEKKPLYHPVPADGRLFRKVADRLTRLSADLRTAWTVDHDRVTTPGACP